MYRNLDIGLIVKAQLRELKIEVTSTELGMMQADLVHVWPWLSADSDIYDTWHSDDVDQRDGFIGCLRRELFPARRLRFPIRGTRERDDALRDARL
jgi:hypothetical protein